MNTQAQVGYIGSVQLQPETGSDTSSKIVVRVTSSDIRTSQDIQYPDVVDSRVDNTIYQVGPKVTGGNLSFPLVHEGSSLGSLSASCTSDTDTLAAKLWQFAAQRDGYGRMANRLSAHVRYADNTAFTYPGCYVNSMTWNVVQQDVVNVTAELFGGSNPLLPDPNRTNYSGDANPSFLSPARVVTWNDAQIEVFNDTGSRILSGQSIREFNLTVNNALERVYTMNGKLAVQDIVPKKRELSGTIKCLGREILLATQAYNNDQNFTSNSAIAFGYTLGSNAAQAFWATAFYGVIFMIEEMAVTTGIFETTHNWRALGDCTRDWLATQLGLGTGEHLSVPLPAPTTYGHGGTNNYGGNVNCFDGSCFPTLTNTGGG
jgi:hypothetical protein